MSEKSTTMFSVMPSTQMTIMPSNIDMGMATATKRLLRIPMKNNSTATTRSSAVMMLFSRSVTMSCTFADWSPRTLKVTPSGQAFACSAASALAASATSRMLAPERLLTAIDTEGMPFMRE